MNAYELADYLDNNLDAGFMSEQKYIDMASEMLRNQADKIEKLKIKIKLTEALTGRKTFTE